MAVLNLVHCLIPEDPWNEIKTPTCNVLECDWLKDFPPEFCHSVHICAKFFHRPKFIKFFISREGGDIGLFITLVPKVLYWRFLIRWLPNFGDFWLNKSLSFSVQTFQPLTILTYRSCNLVYNHWGCTLSYPLRKVCSICDSEIYNFKRGERMRQFLT